MPTQAISADWSQVRAAVKGEEFMQVNNPKADKLIDQKLLHSNCFKYSIKFPMFGQQVDDQNVDFYKSELIADEKKIIKLMVPKQKVVTIATNTMVVDSGLLKPSQARANAQATAQYFAVFADSIMIVCSSPLRFLTA